MTSENIFGQFDLEKKEIAHKKSGLFLIALSGCAAVGLSIACIPFVSPALRRICLPYVPATSGQISNVLEALKGKNGNLLDIGSGDGRIVLAAAKRGFKAEGVELNYWLVLYSRWKAYRSGLTKVTKFHRQDLWRFPLHPYKNVVIFGVEEMMEELEKKLREELSDACVVACRFPIPNRQPERMLGFGVDTVWIYNFRSKE